MYKYTCRKFRLENKHLMLQIIRAYKILHGTTQKLLFRYVIGDTNLQQERYTQIMKK